MNFLILGGNGYLGSKITRCLLERGDCVYCTSRSLSNVSRLKDLKKDITIINTSYDEIYRLIKDIRIDYIVNAACNYGRSDVLYDNVIEANVDFPLMVLNMAVETGVKNYISFGTSLPNDFNMYSFSKKIFSEYGEFYSKKHQINFINLDLEMFYSSDEPKDRFIPSTIISMIKGEEVNTTIGTQRRDIISVDDILNAFLMIVDLKLKGYWDIPVGTGEGPTISEVIDFIWRETGSKSVVNKGAISLRQDEPDCISDVSVLKSMINWEPIDWKTGLKQMINDLQKEMEIK